MGEFVECGDLSPLSEPCGDKSPHSTLGGLNDDQGRAIQVGDSVALQTTKTQAVAG